jgi:hypothetical protein
MSAAPSSPKDAVAVVPVAAPITPQGAFVRSSPAPSSAKDPRSAKEMAKDLAQAILDSKELAKMLAEQQGELYGALDGILASREPARVRFQIPCDGDCLFHALIAACGGTVANMPTDSFELRTALVNHVWANSHDYEDNLCNELLEMHGSLDSYVDTMALAGEWGDELMLRAFMERYNQPFLYRAEDPIEQVFTPTDALDYDPLTIPEICLAGQLHYDAVVKD